MKQKLTQKLILELKADGTIVYDSHQNAPIGFGVRASPTRKVYILQRRVGSRVFKVKVGNVGDFPNIDAARERARELALILVAQKRSPKKIEAERAKRVDAWTIGAIWSRYIAYLESRRDKPTKPATLRAIGTSRRKLQDWEDRPLSSFRSKEILVRFDRGISKPTREAPEGKGRTLMEQTFRWLNAAVMFALRAEKMEADNEDREPAIRSNPFEVLRTMGRYRSGAVLEQDYKRRRTRNPLSKSDGTLKTFLDEVLRLCSGSPQKRQQGDYLYTTLMLGARMSETASLQWRDRVKDPDLCSWADTKFRKVYFYSTKNGTNHEMPMPAGLYTVLMRRSEDRGKSPWIFPVRSTKRTTRTEHYADVKGLMKHIRSRLGFMIRAHDLRRTFGRFADELVSASLVKHFLNHRDKGDTTTRYTEAEWERLQSELQRIECSILSACPDLYNALLPPTYPRIA